MGNPGNPWVRFGREALLLSFLPFLSLPVVAQVRKGGKAEEKVPPELVELEFRDSFDMREAFFLPSQNLFFSGRKAQWDFGLAGGRATFLGTAKRIYLDRNGNGKVDSSDGDPLQGGDILEGSFFFRGKVRTYKIRVEAVFGNDFLRIRPLSCLSGRVGEWEIDFLDANMDGRFFQFGVDRVLVRKEERKGLRGWREPPRFDTLSRVLRLGEELYYLLPLPGGEAVRLLPFRGRTAFLEVRTSKKKVEDCFLLLADPKRDLFFRVQGPGRFSLPKGSYWIRDCRVGLKVPPKKGEGGNGSRYRVSYLLGRSWAGQARVDLRKVGAVLDLGPPFRLSFDALVWGKKGDRVEISDVRLESPSGVRFGADIYESGRSSSIRAYLQAGKERRFLAKLEYG